MLEAAAAVAATNSTTHTVATVAEVAAQAPAANSTSLSGIVPAIQNFASSFAVNVGAVMLSLDSAAIDVGRAVVVFLVIAGIVLWFTRVNKRLGKEFVVGGILIAFFVTYVVPFLMSLNV
jgi:hypothetical protein